MEDLALIVTIIMSVLLLSGPINIGLTSERAQLFTEDRRVLKILRRIIALTIGIIGIFIAIQFLFESLPLMTKSFALLALVGNIYAFRREIKYVKLN
jgi:uncharacterized membrane protein